MLRTCHLCHFCVAIMFSLAGCSLCWGESIRFDAPAMAAGELIGNAIEVDSPDQKIIQFVIPVSATIDQNARVEIFEISAEVHWNRDAYPLVDFSPRTAMHSTIEGNISIEKRTEKSVNAGLNLTSGYFDMVNGAASAGLARNNSETIRYNEIPEHHVLISSGTIDRGTGAKFRFKPSRTSTLEGGRELIVAFRVPSTWRAGILQVTCRAVGKRRIVGSWGEGFDQGTTFVLPVFLKGDQQARQSASRFVRAEQNLRRQVHRDSEEQNEFLSNLQSVFSRDEPAVTEMLVHRLIQTGPGADKNGTGLRLPHRVAQSAQRFVDARQDLLALNR